MRHRSGLVVGVALYGGGRFRYASGGNVRRALGALRALRALREKQLSALSALSALTALAAHSPVALSPRAIISSSAARSSQRPPMATPRMRAVFVMSSRGLPATSTRS